MEQREVFGYAILTALVNVILMIVKIVTGIVGNSYALIADGIESASDILVSLITWIGVGLSLRPADANHPFGHGRIESLAGMFSGLALLGAAVLIAFNSIREILTPHHSPEWYTLPVLIAVVVSKEILARRISNLSELSDSRALEGDAMHHRSDAITSAAAGTGIAIALIGGPRYAAADDWAALIACSMIIFNGGRIFARSFHENVDGRIDSRIEEDIRSYATHIEGIRGIEKCRVRKSGTFYFTEVHVLVDPDCTVTVGHEIAHQFKEYVTKQLPNLKDVVIHIEPYHLEAAQGDAGKVASRVCDP
ncbi:MAG: cation transporter [Akkermansiaceae bacterium]|nr:cation transporter [Akkermansiaceae bacterium]